MAALTRDLQADFLPLLRPTLGRLSALAEAPGVRQVPTFKVTSVGATEVHAFVTITRSIRAFASYAPAGHFAEPRFERW